MINNIIYTNERNLSRPKQLKKIVLGLQTGRNFLVKPQRSSAILSSPYDGLGRGH